MRSSICAFALVSLVAAGCGDDAAVVTTTTVVTDTSTTTAPTTTTTAAAETTTTAVATTTSAVATTTTTGGPTSRCAGLSGMTVPDTGANLIRIPGSFDGDPQPESIMASDGAILFPHDGSWWFGFSLHIPYVVFIELPEASFDAFEPEIHSVENFGDHDDGALVKVDRSTLSGHDVYRFYYLDADCQVEDAGTAAEDPLEFIVGFGASHREGFSCTDDGVWETTAGESGGGLWQRLDTFYEWDPTGTGFIESFTDGFEAPASDPDIGSAGDLDC